MELQIYDASIGDGDTWADCSLEGKHKDGISVEDAQDNLGLPRHPTMSMYEQPGGTTIRASNYRVSAGYARAVALCIELSSNVTALEFSGAALDGAALAIIVEALKKSSVKRLHVDFNRSASLDANILTGLVSLPTVETLSLRGNELDGKAVALRLISDCPALTSLSLYRNNLGDDGCRAVLRALRYNRRLRHLSLGGNCASNTLLNEALAAVTRYKMDEEGAKQRAEVIMARTSGGAGTEDSSKKTKKKGKHKDDGAGSAVGGDLDKIISGGVRVHSNDEVDTGKNSEEEGLGKMLAQSGTILVGTRTLVTLDLSGNPEMGSSSSAQASEDAIAAFVESETAVADMVSGVLTCLKLDNCGLSEKSIANLNAAIGKAKSARAALAQ